MPTQSEKPIEGYRNLKCSRIDCDNEANWEWRGIFYYCDYHKNQLGFPLTEELEMIHTHLRLQADIEGEYEEDCAN